MLERRTVGEISAKPHTLFNVKGEACTEYVFTRDGFSGGFAILYGKTPPTTLLSSKLVKGMDAFIGVNADESPNTRRHFKTHAFHKAERFYDARVALFMNQGCRISTAEGAFKFAGKAFCNGDADELYFFREGEGFLYTMFGKLQVRKHDYVLIPRGVPYVFEMNKEVSSLIVEGDPFIEIPAEFRNPHGQLKLEAPFTHRDFRSPTELLNIGDHQRFTEIITLRAGTLSEHVYKTPPSSTIGWDGSVYPLAFSINDYLPKTGKIHLPPNMHLTFRAKDFVICSFVPRLVDYAEGAIPCPYPHANMHCDEILYYVSGDFTSRSAIFEGSITWHPGGLAHGPQPGRYFASVGTKATNEVAVMVDTWKPLAPSRLAEETEDKQYPYSWAAS